ncbi:hypothetical protein EGJ15_06625 [Pseudomonas sp. p99-361]|nr:hypothetical protein EGJ15_06625 [Pseudomonas sp. p99-361]
MLTGRVQSLTPTGHRKKPPLRNACQLSVTGAALQPFAGTPAPTCLALTSRNARSPVGAGGPAKGRTAAPNY